MSAPPDSDRPDDDLPPLPEPMLGSDEDGAPDFGLPGDLTDELAGERPSFLGSLETRDEPSLGPADDEPLPTHNLPPQLAPAHASLAPDADAPPAFPPAAPTRPPVEAPPRTAPHTRTHG